MNLEEDEELEYKYILRECFKKVEEKNPFPKDNSSNEISYIKDQATFKLDKKIEYNLFLKMGSIRNNSPKLKEAKRIEQLNDYSTEIEVLLTQFERKMYREFKNIRKNTTGSNLEEKWISKLVIDELVLTHMKLARSVFIRFKYHYKIAPKKGLVIKIKESLERKFDLFDLVASTIIKERTYINQVNVRNLHSSKLDPRLYDLFQVLDCSKFNKGNDQPILVKDGILENGVRYFRDHNSKIYLYLRDPNNVSTKVNGRTPIKIYEIEVVPNAVYTFYIYQPNRLNHDTPNRNTNLPEHFYLPENSTLMDTQLILNNEYYPKNRSNGNSYDRLMEYNEKISLNYNDGLLFLEEPNDLVKNTPQAKMKIHLVPKSLGTATILTINGMTKSNTGKGMGVYGDFESFYCESAITPEFLRNKIKLFYTNILDKLPEAPNFIGFDNGFYGVCCDNNGGDALHSLLENKLNGTFKRLFDLSHLEEEERIYQEIERDLEKLEEIAKNNESNTPLPREPIEKKQLEKFGQLVQLNLALKEKMLEIWNVLSRPKTSSPMRSVFSNYLIGQYFTFLKCVKFKEIGHQPNGTYLNKWYNPKVKPPKIRGFSTETREFMDQNLQEIDYEYLYVLKKEWINRKEKKVQLFPNTGGIFKLSIGFSSDNRYFGIGPTRDSVKLGKKVVALYSEETNQWFNTNNTDFEGETLNFEISQNKMNKSYLLSLSSKSVKKVSIFNPMMNTQFYLWQIYIYPMTFNSHYLVDTEVESVVCYFWK